MKRFNYLIVLAISFLMVQGMDAQETYDLQRCVKLALENNNTLNKSKLDLEKSLESRRELMGSLLPQVNGSGSFSYNVKKSKFVMPNFINDMLPVGMQDPNASKYMTIEMGTNFSAGLGATLNQQLLNFTLFNTLEIAKTGETLAKLGVEAKEEDVVMQIANLYYAIQSTTYAAQQLEQSVNLLDKMLASMETNFQNGLVKKVDVDRMKVNRVNVATQQSAIQSAIEVQKNLLKLQMGLEMNHPLSIEALDINYVVKNAETSYLQEFTLNQLTTYQLLQQQQRIGDLQVKSVKSELLPSLSLAANYQYNLLGDKLFSSSGNYTYPSSVIGLNLRIPIFAGLSKDAKLKGANLERKKLKEDEEALSQSLTMAYQNALLKLNDSQRTIEAQRKNKELADEVFRITEENFRQGIASMSDVLNANASLIQSQISYADALSKYMTAYIELRKANGTIKELVTNN